ncbi:SDR family NAD(P)-dependent oxidoreductase [Uliginosibacterium paludis]|uniref:SDR family NAD(P)-dependent oxidoreductase n=1 Tax=Uliginosibacterium paludis TaxID=1615952 RepID=A0ABV2CQQ6_9RHOO
MHLVILTGGSRGIGLALVRQFEASGHRLIEFSRSAPHPFSRRVDLADPLAAREAIHAGLADLDDKSIESLTVIGNAGVLEPIGPAAFKDPAAVLANLNAGFVSGIVFYAEVVARFQHLAVPKRLANISSGAADKGYAGWSLYCAAKAGLENYIRALALEQAAMPHPFLPLNILPGVVDTGMQALIRGSGEEDFPARERFATLHRDGLLASPDEVARRIRILLARSDLQPGSRLDVRDLSADEAEG